MRLRFIPIRDNRRFITIEPTLVAIPGVGVAFAEPPGSVTDAVVRVKFTVSEDLARKVDQQKIKADLMMLGAERVILRPTIVREQRARVAAMADDLTETAALDLWLAAQGINGDTAAALHAAHAVYLTQVRS